VLIARVVPVVRAFISLPAGVARMRPWRFTLYTLIGALTWDVALTLAGYSLGESWRTVEKFMKPISIVIAVLLVAFVAWWVVRRVRARRLARSSEASSGDASTAPGSATEVPAPAERES
jgi:membrane protein DedA with SNARE-associated domain